MFERSCVKRSIFIEKLVQRFVTFKFPFSDIFLFFFFLFYARNQISFYLKIKLEAFWNWWVED